MCIKFFSNIKKSCPQSEFLDKNWLEFLPEGQILSFFGTWVFAKMLKKKPVVDSNKLKFDIHQAFTCNGHSSRKFMLLLQKLFVNSVWAHWVPYKTILFQKILEPVMRSRKNATIFPFIFDYYFLGNRNKEGRVLFRMWYTKLTFVI